MRISIFGLGRVGAALFAALGAAGHEVIGVDVNDDGRGSLPFTVHGTGSVAGGAVEVDASSSSQFVSALLLSASRFDDGLDLTHSGERIVGYHAQSNAGQFIAQKG